MHPPTKTTGAVCHPFSSLSFKKDSHHTLLSSPLADQTTCRPVTVIVTPKTEQTDLERGLVPLDHEVAALRHRNVKVQDALRPQPVTRPRVPVGLLKQCPQKVLGPDPGVPEPVGLCCTRQWASNVQAMADGSTRCHRRKPNGAELSQCRVTASGVDCLSISAAVLRSQAQPT